MPEKMQQILAALEARIEFKAIDYEARKGTSYHTSKDVAIIPIVGTITQRPSLFASGGVSTEFVQNALSQALDDKSIGAIVFDVDSPGGEVYGVQELSEAIYKARGRKPMVAVSNSLMASAAYWIASAADEVVATPGGEVGSVGVVAVHMDYSEQSKMLGIKPTIIKAGKYKAEGNPYQALEDEAVAAIQSRIDEYYDMFTGSLARNRNVSKTEAKFGEGRVFGAKEAKQRGLVDRVATLNEVLRDITSTNRTTNNKAYIEMEKLR